MAVMWIKPTLMHLNLPLIILVVAPTICVLIAILFPLV